MEKQRLRSDLREDQILVFREIAHGKSAAQIAAMLDVSRADVERLIRKTCRQLDVSSRHDATRKLAAEFGWQPQHLEESAGPAAMHQFGANLHSLQTGMVQTKHEHRGKSAYSEIVGQKRSKKVVETGKPNETTRSINSSPDLSKSQIVDRLLLMIILVIGSSLALSVTISAMKGLDDLIAS